MCVAFAAHTLILLSMDPVTVGLIATGIGASIFGANQSRDAQTSANEANMKINENNIKAAIYQQQIANQFSEKMYNQSKADALQQYYREIEYNDPKAQMARYAAAGINPRVSGETITSGGASANLPSPPSGASGSTPSSIPMQPVDVSSHYRQMAFDALSNYATLTGSSADARLKNSQAVLNETDAKTRAIQNRVVLANLRKDGKISDAEYKRLMLDNQFNEQTMDKRIEGVGLENEQLNESIQSIKMQSAYAKEQIATEQLQRTLMKESNKRDWKRLQQDIKESASRIALNDNLGKKAIAEAAESIERKNKLNWENRPYMRILLNRQLEATIDRIKSETAVNEQRTSIYGAVGTAAGAIGTAAGMYYGGKHLIGRGLNALKGLKRAPVPASSPSMYGTPNYTW